jgi:teichuronic acid biosynthesis glycosyltransferase TuaC
MRPRVLVLSRNYPNDAQKLLGLWVRQIVAGSTAICDPKVVAPVPWAPRVPGLPEGYRRFQGIARRSDDDGVEVLRPRLVVGPGSTLAATEAASYTAAVSRTVARLRRTFPFDLVHAHFTYPDGVAAVLLGRRYGVPVVITEQAPWRPWLDAAPLVRRQAVWAARRCAFHVAISSAVRASIEHHTGPSARLRVIPDAVDDSVFVLPANGARRIDGQLLFVGAIRRVKGVDVLLRSLRLLADRGRDVSLRLVGEGHFERYARDQEHVRSLTTELGLEDRVEFVGRKPLAELVGELQQSAALVLPSRAESLGMVLVEALACGTPVVATRCGGPEDIVDESVGTLVPPEDPVALAGGIERVLDREPEFERASLREHVLCRFGLDSVIGRYADLYEEALAGR